MAIVLVAGHHSPGGGSLRSPPGRVEGGWLHPLIKGEKIKYLYAWPAGQGDAAQNG